MVQVHSLQKELDNNGDCLVLAGNGDGWEDHAVVTCSLKKNEDPRLAPEKPYTNSGHGTHSCSPSNEEMRQVDVWGLMMRQPRLLGEVQVPVRDPV